MRGGFGLGLGLEFVVFVFFFFWGGGFGFICWRGGFTDSGVWGFFRVWGSRVGLGLSAWGLGGGGGAEGLKVTVFFVEFGG